MTSLVTGTSHNTNNLKCIRGQLHMLIFGRSSGLMVSALDSEGSGPGSSPGQGHCCVLGQDILLSGCLSPPRCINWYRQI